MGDGADYPVLAAVKPRWIRMWIKEAGVAHSETDLALELHAKLVARRIVDGLCEDPEIWLTHGIPGDEKLALVEDRIAAGLVEFLKDVR